MPDNATPPAGNTRAGGLDAVFRPRTVAVIGASRQRDTIPADVFRNLIERDFAGTIYPVNPNADAVHGVRAYPDIGSVPEPVDLAVIVVPARLVVEVMRQCAAADVRAAVVISAGFKEVGEEGRTREAELLAVAREAGIRVVGPNCLGVINTDPDVRLHGTFTTTWPPPGRVGLLTQSGAVGVAMLDYARQLNIGISDFVSVGNRVDVSANDLLEYWERDPSTDLCLLYLESFGNPHKFTRIARRVSRRKPIVAVKSGRSEVGRRAASSHTGSLAGVEAGVEALLRQTGVVRVDTIEELFNTAMLLAHQPLPAGRRVAIVTNAGGPGIMAADAAAAGGLEVPELSEACQAELRQLLPAEASLRNPIDMIASATAEQYERTVRTVLAADEIDAVLVIFLTPVARDPSAVAEAIARAAREAPTAKPVAANLLGLHGVAESTEVLRRGHVPSYPFPESAARCLARAADYAAWRARPAGTRPELERDRETAAALLDAAEPGAWLPPDDAFALLDCYGIPTVPTELARDPDAAVAAARRLGFPVAVKLASRTLVHKTDVRGVRLGLETGDDVHDAFLGIRDRTKKQAGADAFEGVVVQPMVDDGVELVVGAALDPTFGHLIMAGLGGVFVELLEDVSFRLQPLTDREAAEMLRQLRGFPLLDGYRGEPPADVDAVEDILLRLSWLLSDHPTIAEVDLNPVIVLEAGRGCRVVDARVRVAEPELVPTPPLEELVGGA